jgi:hypothetical protein
MNQLRLPRRDVGWMMVDHQPPRFVQPRLKGEVADPGDALSQFTAFPTLVMMRLQPDIGFKQAMRQPLQEQSTHETIEVAFMRQNDFRLGEIVHRAKLLESGKLNSENQLRHGDHRKRT